MPGTHAPQRESRSRADGGADRRVAPFSRTDVGTNRRVTLSAAGISALMFYFTGTAPAFLIRSDAAEEVA